MRRITQNYLEFSYNSLISFYKSINERKMTLINHVFAYINTGRSMEEEG